jgi:hypothetical protein
VGSIHRVFKGTISTESNRVSVETKSTQAHTLVINPASHSHSSIAINSLTTDSLASTRILDDHLRLALGAVGRTAITIVGIAIITLLSWNHREVEVAIATDRLATETTEADPVKSVFNAGIAVFEDQILAGDAVVTKIERARIGIIAVDIFETNVGDRLECFVGTTGQSDERDEAKTS